MDEPKSHDDHEREVTYMDDIVPRALVLRVLMWTGIIGVSLCVIAYLILAANERALRPGRKFPERWLPAPHEVSNVRQEPFAPATPASTIADGERARLRSYGWVDQQKRVVHIPIDRAVELLLAGQPRGAGVSP
ncbi:MAG TPA: hypothetical protein VF334_19175 [Polyangia bacterium]